MFNRHKDVGNVTQTERYSRFSVVIVGMEWMTCFPMVC